MTTTLLLEQIFNGLQAGITLFLIAAGLTLILGIMDFVFLAHGSQVMIGAYAASAVTIATNNFYDLSDIFDSSQDQFFYDHGHLGKKGNLVISDRMYKTIFE